MKNAFVNTAKYSKKKKKKEKEKKTPKKHIHKFIVIEYILFTILISVCAYKSEVSLVIKRVKSV